MPTGAGNEIWSYGTKVEDILTKYVRIRELLKDYLDNLMQESHEFGYPIMRPLFYEFKNDKLSWEVDNIYMLGDSILVSPILYYKDRKREVYLPADENWIDLYTNKVYKGGKKYIVDAGIEKIPVFIRERSKDNFKELFKYIEKNINK